MDPLKIVSIKPGNLLFLLVSAILAGGVLYGADDPNYPDSPDPLMGQFIGERTLQGGIVEPVYAQVIPRGWGNYEVRLRQGMETLYPSLVSFKGMASDSGIGFSPTIGRGADDVLQVTEEGLLIDASLFHARLENDVLSGYFAGKEFGQFKLERTEIPVSPTLGKKAPKGAIVLFNGKNLKKWKNWERSGSGKPAWEIKGDAMEVTPGSGNLMTKDSFGDHLLHVEFRSPFMPTALGQKRGNSGVYLHGRYEVQVLDSFGLEGEWNECGGIYKVARPAINMCAPPTVWQTYDITFRSPRFDSEGNKTENARITVEHNGVVIHDDIELPEFTGGSIEGNEVPEGPLLLQNHGDPVQYRNIWVLEQ